jgi:predicted O-linked N-acetylglucosamine transferase (SPINDLY family)
LTSPQRLSDPPPIGTQDPVDSLKAAAENAVREGDLERATAIHAQILELRPQDAVAHYKCANTLKDLGRLETALERYERAIALNPAYAFAFCNRGVVLERLGRFDEALASYQSSIALNPGDALSHYNCGSALRKLGRLEEALASLDTAVSLAPTYVQAHCNRGNVLKDLKRGDEALASYDRSIEIHPGFSEAHLNRGILLAIKRQFVAAVASFDRAIELNPDYAIAHCCRGTALIGAKQWHAGFASIDRAIALASSSLDEHGRPLMLDPAFRYVLGLGRYGKMTLCNWTDFDADIEHLAQELQRDPLASPPFPLLALFDEPSLHLKVARAFTETEHPVNPSLPAIVGRATRKKIHVAYFSADFHIHPIGLLLAELFEIHDRDRFDVTGFSFGPETQDPVRKRLENAFDRFIDARSMTDEEVAMLARNLGVDIAVDLVGHTGDARTDIFALRAAPVQVNYLGYIGTMGADYIDYIVADRTVITPQNEAYFAEKIIYLPDTFQVNDRKREISARVFTRAELGLPPSGFVFCCFNSHYKILPATFAGWMRILTRVPGSVLMLVAGDPAIESNLRAEAARHAVDPRRLVFVGRLSPPDYLARCRAADLFLDTLPYNAGATASDALWAGLPVLTCLGKAFAGRAAASLLKAVDLPELITSTPLEYEDLAVALARDQPRIAVFRARLEENRLTSRLFDTSLFTRNLESAYTMIHARFQAGHPPDHIEV